jgi:flagellar basal-body rod modification protein FlgD
VSAISPTATSPTTTPKAGETAEKVASLGKDDFLKLLVAQLQHQDPMQPMDNAEYMGQLAQFSTLEQITNFGEEMKRVRASTQVDQAVSLIGKEVGYTLADGTAATGVVESVAIEDGEISLKIGGADVNPAAITSVRPGAPTS